MTLSLSQLATGQGLVGLYVYTTQPSSKLSSKSGASTQRGTLFCLVERQTFVPRHRIPELEALIESRHTHTAGCIFWLFASKPSLLETVAEQYSRPYPSEKLSSELGKYTQRAAHFACQVPSVHNSTSQPKLESRLEAGTSTQRSPSSFDELQTFTTRNRRSYTGRINTQRGIFLLNVKHS